MWENAPTQPNMTTPELTDKFLETINDRIDECSRRIGKRPRFVPPQEGVPVDILLPAMKQVFLEKIKERTDLWAKRLFDAELQEAEIELWDTLIETIYLVERRILPS